MEETQSQATATEAKPAEPIAAQEQKAEASLASVEELLHRLLAGQAAANAPAPVPAAAPATSTELKPNGLENMVGQTVLVVTAGAKQTPALVLDGGYVAIPQLDNFNPVEDVGRSLQFTIGRPVGYSLDGALNTWHKLTEAAAGKQAAVVAANKNLQQALANRMKQKGLL